MRLYLDDDCIDPLLVRLLGKAGHDVELPAAVGLAGNADVLHLTHAIRQDRVFISRNYQDFEYLHLLLIEGRGHHPGILVIRQDNNPKRDLTRSGIVRALGNVIAAGVPIAEEYIILNHWR